jgi:hypothetical protein
MREEDLARNDPGMHANVLYARSGASVELLRRAFRARSIWRYESGSKQGGRLRCIWQPTAAVVQGAVRVRAG